MFNKDFVWTNQLKQKKETKINKRKDTKLDKSLNFENCSLKSPDESFYLKRLNKLGFGLFAKHYKPKGLFSFLLKIYKLLKIKIQ